MGVTMKIMIIGSGGAGKSTFARQLGSLSGLPVYHLDRYFWKPGWVATPREEWAEFQKELVQRESNIMGNLGRT